MQTTTLGELSQTNQEKVFDFLSLHPVGVLALVGADGKPHASTIYFTVGRDLTITFTTKRDTRKHQILTKDSDVMLVAYDAANQAAVQVSGSAIEIDEPELASKIYYGTLHAASTTGVDVVPPIAKIAAGPYIAYAIHPETISMSEYSWGDNFAHAMKHAADSETTEDPA